MASLQHLKSKKYKLDKAVSKKNSPEKGSDAEKDASPPKSGKTLEAPRPLSRSASRPRSRGKMPGDMMNAASIIANYFDVDVIAQHGAAVWAPDLFTFTLDKRIHDTQHIRETAGPKFGLDEGAWELVEEKTWIETQRERSILKKTLKRFKGIKIRIWAESDFYDPRVPDGPYSIERTLITSDEEWNQIIQKYPLTRNTRTQACIQFLEKLTEVDSEEAVYDGMHGIWELAVNSEHHVDFGPSTLELVVSMLSNTAREPRLLALCAAIAWSLSVTARTRQALVQLGILEAYIGLVKLLLEDTKKPPDQRMDMQMSSRILERCIGALAILVVDQKCRSRLFELEPDADTLISVMQLQVTLLKFFGAGKEAQPVKQEAVGKQPKKTRNIRKSGAVFAYMNLHAGHIKGEYVNKPIRNGGGHAPKETRFVSIYAAEALTNALLRDKEVRLIFAERGLSNLIPMLAIKDTRLRTAITTAFAVYGYNDATVAAMAQTGNIDRSLIVLAQMVLDLMKDMDEVPAGRPLKPDDLRLLCSACVSVWSLCQAAVRGQVAVPLEVLKVLLASTRYALHARAGPHVLFNLVGALASSCRRQDISNSLMHPEELADPPSESEEEEEDPGTPTSEKPPKAPKPKPPAPKTTDLLMTLITPLASHEDRPDTVTHLGGAELRAAACIAIGQIAGHPWNVEGEEQLDGVYREALLLGEDAMNNMSAATSLTSTQSKRSRLSSSARSLHTRPSQMVYPLSAFGPPSTQLFQMVLTTALEPCRSSEKTNDQLIEAAAACLMLMSTHAASCAVDRGTVEQLLHLIVAASNVGGGKASTCLQLLMAATWCLLRHDQTRRLVVSLRTPEDEARLEAVRAAKQAKAEAQAAKKAAKAKKAERRRAIRLGLAQPTEEDAEDDEEEGGDTDDEEDEAREDEEEQQEEVPHGGWFLNVMEDVAFKHLAEFRIATHHRDPVVVMFSFWVGCIWLAIVDPESTPSAAEKVYEERSIGIWTVPDVHVEPPVATVRLNQKVIALLQEVIEMRGDSHCVPRELSIGLAWNMCARDMGLETQLLAMGISSTLTRAAMDEAAPHGVRMKAVAFLQVLIEREQHRARLEKVRGQEGLHDSLLLLVQSHAWCLADAGARGVARRACDPAAKQALVRSGVIECLVHLLQRILAHINRGDPPDEVMEQCKGHALSALQNISTTPRHQVAMAKRGLRTIMEVNLAEPEGARARTLSEAILSNLAQNPKNRTRLYKVELLVKAAAHSARSTTEILRRTFRRAEYCMEVGQGWDGYEADANVTARGQSGEWAGPSGGYSPPRIRTSSPARTSGGRAQDPEDDDCGPGLKKTNSLQMIRNRYDEFLGSHFKSEVRVSYHPRSCPSAPLDPEEVEEERHRKVQERRKHRQRVAAARRGSPARARSSLGATTSSLGPASASTAASPRSVSVLGDLPTGPLPSSPSAPLVGVASQSSLLFERGEFASGRLPVIGAEADWAVEEDRARGSKRGVHLPKLANSMCGPLARTWELGKDTMALDAEEAAGPRARAASAASDRSSGSTAAEHVKYGRRGRSRWTPPVAEYRECSTSKLKEEYGESGDGRPRLPAVTRKLLSLERPSSVQQRLSTAAKDLAVSESTDVLLRDGHLKKTQRPLAAHPEPPLDPAQGPSVPITVLQPAEEEPSNSDTDPEEEPSEGEEDEDEGGPAVWGERARAPMVHLEVQVAPVNTRNLVAFGKHRSPEKSRSGVDLPRAILFEHVEGCCVCHGLYAHYLLPNGKLGHYYDRGTTIIDEVTVELAEAPPRPGTLELLLQLKLPYAAVLDQLALPETAVQQVEFKPFPPMPVLPRNHTLEVRDPASIEKAAFGNLKLGNFVISLDPELVEREEESEAWEDIVYKEPWTIERSVFAPRKRECDSKAFENSAETLSKMFDKDWARCTKKERFVSFLTRANKKEKADNGVSDKQMMADVKAVIWKHFQLLDSTFTYYSCLGSGSSFSMQLNEYTDFLDETKIPDPHSQKCKRSDCDTLFITADFQEDKTSAEALVADGQNALIRHEFVEVLIRIAMAKFGGGIATHSVHKAVEMLVDQHITPNVPTIANEDSNEFRRDRLYTEEMDDLFRQHIDMLQIIYKRFITRPTKGRRPRLMGLDHWLTCVAKGHLLQAGMTLREAKICFLRARMTVIDEVLDRTRFEGLTFVDFLECLGRVAEMQSTPSESELREMRYNNILEYYQACEQNKGNEGLKGPSGAPHPPQRPSSQFGAPKTRPLHVKVKMLLDGLFRFLDFDVEQPAAFSYTNLYKTLKQIDHKIERGTL